jgi:hypothetical protein
MVRFSARKGAPDWVPPGREGDFMGLLGRLVAVSISLAGLVLASSATAHELEVPRANKANKSFAKSLCAASDDPKESCISSSPGPCNRISDHRVRCVVFITLEAEDKSQGRCLTLIEWYLRGKSPLLRVRFLGVQSCQQVRPPQPPAIP